MGAVNKHANTEKRSLSEFLDRINDVLKPEGAIAQNLHDYEYRVGQIAMARTVAQALWQGRVGLIEAGTGTGKSLAYLIPAAYWATLSGEKVIVSTNTITLQEQLINKDVPFLQSVLDIAFRVAVIKGWSNYLCLSRFLAVGQQRQVGLWENGEQELTALAEWVSRCKTGSRSEVDFPLSEETWWEVCAEGDICLRADCPYLERCFYFAERKQAFEADIIIVNHHLLFADLSLRQVLGFDTQWSVLPPYRYVIWDEAHHVEDVATEYFGFTIGRVGITRLLSRLQRVRRGRASGILPYIRSLLSSEGGLPAQRAQTAIQQIEQEVIPALRGLEIVSNRFFGELVRLMGTRSSSDRVLALPPTPGAIKLWQIMAQERVDLVNGLDQLEAAVTSLRDCLSAGDGETWHTVRAELGAICSRLSGNRRVFEFISGDPDPDFVYWAALSGRRREPNLHAAPIEVSEPLRAFVYQNLQGAIFTSATLAIDQCFDHICQRLGLDLEGDMNEEHCLSAPPLEEIIGSPFDYREQALLCVPTDIEAPRQGRYGKDLATYILDVLLVTLGRAFVLFTSYRLLNEVYAYCKDSLADAGISALCQGKAARGLLLDRFRADTRSVLFGTSSFWEGVDVPGETLSCVILTKLPFQVPSHPIVSARVRRLEENGLNAFAEYMLPQAVIRFKQGFGRLIRRTTDHGVVVVCDTRLLSKTYGEIFLHSIPECRVVARSGEETLAAISAWLS
ncbi:MAG: DEAD/DEAH box helicase [Firmicutes bacterium]|nr:DEAD/DEAH box helicase [Bacillota bacterium]